MGSRREDGVRKNRLGPAVKLVASLILIVTIGVVVKVLYGQSGDEPLTEVGTMTVRRAVPVVVRPAGVREFARTAVVQGSVQAKNCVKVSPRISGTIEAIFVEEGDLVVAGQTKLFAVDQVNLEKAVQIAERNLDVARFATLEKEASLDRASADFHKAQLDYGRYQRLREKETVTQDAFEQQESRYQQLQAMLKHAHTLVELSKAQERQAQAALDVAKKNLADAVVYAPISGVVSERLQEPGEMASPGNPILRIDDPSVVEIAAFLPSQYYPQVVVDRTIMNVRVAQTEILNLVTCYRSPTINPTLRTFEVRCVVENPPVGVVPGAMANIAIVLETRQGLGVPSMCLQERGGQCVVFAVRDNVAQQEAITTGIEADGWIEVRQGNLKENEPVVTLGQNMLEQGRLVDIRQEEN